MGMNEVTPEIGKRYERLLLFTAPLTLAAIMVWLIALGSTRAASYHEGRCYGAAAKVLNPKLDTLKKAWLHAQPKKKSQSISYSYRDKMTDLLIDSAALDHECKILLIQTKTQLKDEDPDKVIAALEHKYNELTENPLEMYGVKIPTKPTVDLLGNKLQVELSTSVLVLQIVLLPALLMWLASLYHTRYREAYLIGKSTHIVDVYPHVINVLPTGQLPRTFNRKAMTKESDIRFLCGLYTFIRICLLSAFILPAIVAYVASLYLTATLATGPFAFVAGLVVCVFTLSALLLELKAEICRKVLVTPYDAGA
jgi:hypothetical protein